MWDFPLYAVNVLLPLVNKKAALGLWQHGIERVGNSKQRRAERKAESERCHVAPPETESRTLAHKPQPHGNTKINRNGFK